MTAVRRAVLVVLVMLGAACGNDGGGVTSTSRGDASRYCRLLALPAPSEAFDVAVFIRPEAGDAVAQQVGSELGAVPGVDRVTVVTQQQAFEEFRRLFANEPEFTHTVTPADLPGSVRVRTSGDAVSEAIAQRFRNRPGVFKVKFPDRLRMLEVLVERSPWLLPAGPDWPRDTELDAVGSAAPADIRHDVAVVTADVAARRDGRPSGGADWERAASQVKHHAEGVCHLSVPGDDADHSIGDVVPSSGVDETTVPGVASTRPSTTSTLPLRDCRRGDISSVLTVAQAVVAWNQPVVLTVTQTNISGSACTVVFPPGTRRAALLYIEGADRGWSWSWDYCGHAPLPMPDGGADVWPAGHREVQTVTWNGTEQVGYNGPDRVGCRDAPMEPGTYRAFSVWAGTTHQGEDGIRSETTFEETGPSATSTTQPPTTTPPETAVTSTH